jgi:3-oxoacyl-[acyl-carrier protein] reductase
MKRLGTPEDVASTVVFLAFDKAEFLTGQITGINGGKTAF